LEALADHYGADEEAFKTAEAVWNGENDYAELVMRGNGIIGAVDRPITAADIASIGRVRWMQKRSFINRIRSLSNIEGFQLPELTNDEQRRFVRDPLRYLLDADEAQSDAIMREIENRQKDILPIPVSVNPVAPPIAKAPKSKKAKPKVEGQRELLLPIAGGKSERDRPAKIPAAGRKVG
jgi:hypothetical protein